jgi:hypothetical protein
MGTWPGARAFTAIANAAHHAPIDALKLESIRYSPGFTVYLLRALGHSAASQALLIAPTPLHQVHCPGLPWTAL